MSPVITIIDANPQIREDVGQLLRTHHYRSTLASSVGQGLYLIKKSSPSLIITELLLPDCNGLRVVRQIRLITEVPIIVLSTLADEETKLGAFQLGIDDYVIKPSSSAELLARVKAILRRSNPRECAESLIRLGKLEINLENKEATCDGERLRLTPTEWQLLRTLIKYSGQVVDHQTLLAQTWGPSYSDDIQYLHVYMRKLRKKLELNPSNPRFLMTEWGVGYRLVV